MGMVVSLNKNQEITHDSKINGTDVTINQVMSHGDVLQVGPHTFTKHCKWTFTKCIITRCPTDPNSKQKCRVRMHLHDESATQGLKLTAAIFLSLFALF